MTDIEIEFKNMLTLDEYHQIYQYYHLEKQETIYNKNYYYDTPDNLIKNNQAALRIRHNHQLKEITLKEKSKSYNQEINIRIANDEIKNALTLADLPDAIKHKLLSYDKSICNLYLIEKIETKRKELPIGDNLLVLDETRFLNGVIDYELEFEVRDYKVGKKQFEEILNHFNIAIKKAKPKIARAADYKKL